MVHIDNEITNEWETPKEGFSDNFDEDEDYEISRFGMNSIDKLISSIGKIETLPLLSVTINNVLNF